MKYMLLQEKGTYYIVESKYIHEAYDKCGHFFFMVSKSPNRQFSGSFGKNFSETILSAYGNAEGWQDSGETDVCETEWFTFKKPKSPTFYVAEVVISEKLSGREGRALWAKVFGL